ncbi:hypothetical protein [Jiella sp. M17.18]
MTTVDRTPARDLKGLRRIAAYVRQTAEVFSEARQMRDEIRRRYPHMVD